MHELSICQSLIDTLEREAQKQDFTRVKILRLEIGRFAGVEIEALRFGFEVSSRGTVCDGASLEVIELPGRAYCFHCEETVDLDSRLDPCPRCGSGRMQATGGDELKIKDLEVV